MQLQLTLRRQMLPIFCTWPLPTPLEPPAHQLALSGALTAGGEWDVQAIRTEEYAQALAITDHSLGWPTHLRSLGSCSTTSVAGPPGQSQQGG